MPNKLILVLAMLTATTALAAPGRLPLEAVPEHYSITLAPHLGTVTFDGHERVTLRVAKPTATVTLNAADYVVTRGAVGDNVAAVKQDADAETVTFTFSRPLPAGTAELDIAWNGKLSDKLAGFYHAESEGKRYAFTDFEPADARRAFPCFDEPALKARFAMTAVIDPSDVAVSNTPQVSETIDAKTKLKTVKFAETPRLSTYLVALAVGPLVETKTMAGKTPIRVWTTPGKAKLAGFALASAAELLPWFETYFGVPYAYGKLDLVGVPDFEAGAMENAGAIFFRESALLADDHASPETKRRVATVIAHEMAHQWFGDLVTMQWWDDVWLNEAFATWAETRSEAALHPEMDAWLDLQRFTQLAMQQDSLAATHPIRMPVATPEQAKQQFDYITYEKGASVLRMLERWLGEETWRRGIHEYLRQHAEANATGADLWRALGAVSKQPVSDVARSWFERGGHPLVAATVRCNAGKTELVLEQHRDGNGGSRSAEGGANDDAPWLIPLCARTKAGTQCALMRMQKETRVVANTCEPWAIANASESGFYRVRYDVDTLRALGHAAEKSLEPIERLALVADEWALVRDGRAPLSAYLELVAQYRGEPKRDVIESIALPLERVGHELVGERDRDGWRRFVGDVFGGDAEALGWQARPGDDEERRRVRGALWEMLGDADIPSVLQAAAAQLPHYLADPASVDPSLASAIVKLAAGTGDAGRWQTYHARMVAATTPEERDRFMFALTDFRLPALVDKSLALSLAPEVRSQDVARYLGLALGHPWSRRAAWQFLKKNYAAVAQKTPPQMMTRMVGSMRDFCEPDLVADAMTFWSDKKVPGLKRQLAQGSELARECIAMKQREAQPLSNWLRAHTPKHAAR